MKAMILAAGRGERMKPLTDTTPKPLLKVGQQSLIEHQIRRLVQAGITDIVINVHYRKEQIKATLQQGTRLGANIVYSDEATRLGTGGGIVHALAHLGMGHFILTSADLWTTFPYETLKNRTNTPGHLVLVDNPPFHTPGDFGLHEGYVTGDTHALTFAGIGVFHPSVFQDGQQNTPAGLIEFLTPLIQQHQLTGEHYTGTWDNVGTPQQLERLNLDSML